MKEQEFHNKYKKINNSVAIYDTIEDIEEEYNDEWLLLDGSLYSLKWGEKE